MNIDTSEVLKAIIDILKNDAAFTALVPATSTLNFHPAVAPEENLPLPVASVIISDMNEWDTKSDNGIELTVLVDAWSKYRGDKELHDISLAVSNALHRNLISIPGMQVVQCYNTRSTIIHESTDIRHLSKQFRLLISQ